MTDDVKTNEEALNAVMSQTMAWAYHAQLEDLWMSVPTDSRIDVYRSIMMPSKVANAGDQLIATKMLAFWSNDNVQLKPSGELDQRVTDILAMRTGSHDWEYTNQLKQLRIVWVREHYSRLMEDWHGGMW